jgi:hypothetical protein
MVAARDKAMNGFFCAKRSPRNNNNIINFYNNIVRTQYLCKLDVSSTNNHVAIYENSISLDISFTNNHVTFTLLLLLLV